MIQKNPSYLYDDYELFKYEPNFLAKCALEASVKGIDPPLEILLIEICHIIHSCYNSSVWFHNMNTAIESFDYISAILLKINIRWLDLIQIIDSSIYISSL